MELDARRLRVLAAVVRSHGVIDAGRALSMSPQAVSQNITALEREIGTLLFDRSRRRLEPSQLASSLAAHGDRIDAELLAARRSVAEHTGQVSGVVRIATFQSAIRWLVVSALPRIRAAAPGIVAEVVEMSGDLERPLRAGVVDLAIDEQDSPDGKLVVSEAIRGLVTTLVRRDPYRLVMSPTHDVRALRDAWEKPWIVAPSGSASRDALDRLAAKHRADVRIAHTCLEFPAVLALVDAGEGVALVPSLALTDRTSTTGVSTVKGLGSRHLVALQRTSRRGTEPAVDHVIRALIDS
jgi:DNA-binding transcriptional LysR family regulator